MEASASVEPKVYLPNEVTFSIDEIKDRKEPRNVLVVTPDHFDIVDVKNVHMEGNIGNFDKKLAQDQWSSLKEVYESLKAKGMLECIYVLKGTEGYEDMVFAANQSFPWVLDGVRVVVLSKMRHESRQREVKKFRKFYEDLGYKILELRDAQLFEGMGDTIPHYGKNLLYGGYGHRTDLKAYEEISKMLKVPVVALELVDERFYHLDTCFIPADKDSVLLCKEAFSAEGLDAIRKLFKNVIEIPVDEAVKYFALNAHCINDAVTEQRAAILQKGSTVMKQALCDLGFQVFEIDTSEYMKSGGSVFCMKMMLY